MCSSTALSNSSVVFRPIFDGTCGSGAFCLYTGGNENDEIDEDNDDLHVVVLLLLDEVDSEMLSVDMAKSGGNSGIDMTNSAVGADGGNNIYKEKKKRTLWF
jgi:hypothetical protein